MLIVQEHLAHLRQDTSKAPHRQTTLKLVWPIHTPSLKHKFITKNLPEPYCGEVLARDKQPGKLPDQSLLGGHGAGRRL